VTSLADPRPDTDEGDITRAPTSSVNATPDVVLRARGLTKVYRTGEIEVQALRAVDIELYRGELLVLLGASGSGKSTLLNILGGPDVPTSGQVSFLDHDLTAANQAALTRYRREHVGFVFQFYNLIPSLTARENVAIVTDIATNPLDPADALRMVGLGERLDNFPAQLSGGDQQRVAVAKRPDILLCDEPTGALDVETGRLVLDVIDRVNRELGTTTVVITHNVVIAGMADRVLRMTSGRLLKSGAMHVASPRRSSPGESARAEAPTRSAPSSRPSADRCGHGMWSHGRRGVSQHDGIPARCS
jgi:putative ABC transport system ATP-binding protein